MTDSSSRSRMFSLVRLIALSVSLVLTLATLGGLPAIAEPTETDAASEVEVKEADDSDGDGVADRPDAVSASMTARATGEKVEDLSARSQTVQRFHHPDGSISLEEAAAPVRVEQDGQWVDVDYDLAKQSDGSYRPKAAPADVSITGGGSTTAATVRFSEDEALKIGWNTALPPPTVEGGIATYKLSPTTDLQIIVTGAGVASRIRLNSAPAADDPVWNLKLQADGVELDQDTSRTLTVTDDDGKQLGSTSPMTAWDATTDKAGEPTRFAPVTGELTETSSAGDLTRLNLELSTTDTFLDDPATKYPVTIDPDISAVSFLRDIWIRNGTTAATASGAGNYHRLFVGRSSENTNTNPAMSLLAWSNSQLAGRTMISATMSLYQYEANSCSARQMYAHTLTSAFNGDSTHYGNRPGVRAEGGVTVTANPGGVGCATPNGRVNINVLGFAQKWAAGTWANHGVQLSVPGTYQNDQSYGRRFCSSQIDTSTACLNGTVVPKLAIRYNGPPATPAVPTAPGTTSGSTNYVTSSKPTWTTSGIDEDLSAVKYEVQVHSSTAGNAASLITSCTTAEVSSGTAASCTPSVALNNGSSYYARARSIDHYGVGGGWSGYRTVVVDTAAPSTPTVSCTDYQDGQWYDDRPAPTTACSFASSSDTTNYDWRLNGQARAVVTAGSSGGAPNATGTVNVPESGEVKIEARAKDRAGNYSGWKTFSFGTGSASMGLPLGGERSTTTFLIEAAGRPNATSAKLQWRLAGESSLDGEYNDAAEGSVTKTDGTVWDGEVSAASGAASTGKLLWDATEGSGAPPAPAVIEVRVCLTVNGAQQCAKPRSVTKVPSAFGGAFPTKDLGVGSLALFTGELQLSMQDVSLDFAGAGSGLSLARSHRSLTGPSTDTAGVFGPGWIADLSGSESSVSGMEVQDGTASNGSITLTSPAGESYTYTHSSKIKGAQKVGTYVASGATVTDNDMLTISGTGLSAKLTMTEESGTATTWSHRGSGVWLLDKVEGPQAVGTTNYSHDSSGRVSGIYAPAPSGVACNGDTQDKGCRALLLTYTGTGDSSRLSSVRLKAWNPKPGQDGKPTSSAGFTETPVVNYSYDAQGRLTEAWDPRAGAGSAALKHTYAYGATQGNTARITALTQPGKAPYTFGYDSQGRLGSLTRQTPASTPAKWTMRYDIATAGQSLPDLRASRVADWGQPADSTPVGGTAIFTPNDANGSDLTNAEISYYRADGRLTNLATYGNGGWLVDSLAHDRLENAVWSLSAKNRQTTLDAEDPSLGMRLAEQTVFNATGTRIEEEFGPAHMVTLDDGSEVTARAHTVNVYDDETAAAGVPTEAGYQAPAAGAPDLNLLVEAQMSAVLEDGTDRDVTRTRYRYSPAQSGDGSGWTMGKPVVVAEQLGNGWSTKRSRFDTDGRVFWTQTPQGAEENNAARTTTTVFYSAAANSAEPTCGSKPEWNGAVCLTSVGSGATAVTTRITGYDSTLAPTAAQETRGTMTRTTVSSFDAAGRLAGTSTALTGVTGASSASATSTLSYSATTGGLISTQSNGKETTLNYDTWGRVTSVSDGSGEVTNTTYDSEGNIATTSDSKGTYSYSYNGNDSTGKAERRGLPTSVTVTTPGQTDATYKMSYDQDGAMTNLTYPGSLSARWKRDAAGNVVGLDYTRSGEDLIGFAARYDIDGRTISQASVQSEQEMKFDDLGRLRSVVDMTGGACEKRTYDLSLDGNRTQTAVSTGSAAASCDATASSVQSQFDNADRLTQSGNGGTYSYDDLGRTTSMPAQDSDRPDGSAVTVAYHANDMVKSLVQTVPNTTGSAAVSKTYSLDAMQRVGRIEERVAGNVTRSTVSHYGALDSTPSWIETTNSGGTPTTTWAKNVTLPMAGLVAIQDNAGGSEMQLSNPRGDVVGTVDPSQSGLSSYGEYEEFGTVRGDAAGTSYGFLGKKARSTDTVGGLTLMGLRLYNPRTGRFLTRDPIAGAGANDYVYPLNPCDSSDPSGASDADAGGGGTKKCKKNTNWKKVEFLRYSYGKWRDLNKIPKLLGKLVSEAFPGYIVSIEDIKLQNRRSIWLFKRCHNKKIEYKNMAAAAHYRWRVWLNFAAIFDRTWTTSWQKAPI